METRVDGALQRARPIGIAKQRALYRRLAVAHVDCRGGWPLGLEALEYLQNPVAQRGVHGEPAFGQVNRGTEHLSEAERAEVLERGAPRRELRGNCCGEEPVRRDHVHVVIAKPLQRGRAGRPALAVDGHAPLLLGHVDQNRDLAADANRLRFQQGHGKACRHACVDCVSALFQDAQADGSRQVVPGGHHAQRALQHRSGGKRHRAGFANGRAVGISIRGKGARGVRH